MDNSISWSAMSTFMECAKSYEYKYVQGLQDNRTSLNMLIGTAFHAGVAAKLKGEPVEEAVANSIEITDWNDVEFIQLVEDAASKAMQMLRAYPLPYRAATEGEVFGTDSDVLMVEWEFEIAGIKGIIDAVVYNPETDGYMVVDWKTRSSMPFDEIAIIDGQLQLYAACLVQAGAKKLYDVCMYQVMVSVPKPYTEYVLKNGGFSTRASLNTTWKHLQDTAPEFANLTDEIKERCKPESSFVNPVIAPVSKESVELALQEVRKVKRSIALATEEDLWVGRRSTYACRNCSFWRLCAGRTQGEDVRHIVEEFYE